MTDKLFGHPIIVSAAVPSFKPSDIVFTRAAQRATDVDEFFCQHCQRDTLHTFIDSGHERDSSSDYRECLTCGWWLVGMFQDYRPPDSEE